MNRFQVILAVGLLLLNLAGAILLQLLIAQAPLRADGRASASGQQHVAGYRQLKSHEQRMHAQAVSEKECFGGLVNSTVTVTALASRVREVHGLVNVAACRDRSIRGLSSNGTASRIEKSANVV